MSKGNMGTFSTTKMLIMSAPIMLFALIVAIAPTDRSWAQQAQAQESRLADDIAIEEITVTARRRQESLQEIPISITSIGPEQMRQQAITQTDQINEFVPNLTFEESERAGNNDVFIRGIGGGFGDPTVSFGVGQYINGIFIPNTIGNSLSTLDIERIEVLRGPQGTLFGKNTTGGAINIITKRPGPDFEGELMYRTGSFGRQDGRLILNYPIREDLYSRVSLGVRHDNGYYENVITENKINDTNIVSGNVALRWLPNDQITVDFTARFMRQNEDNNGGACDFREVTNIQTRFHEDGGGRNFEEACNSSASHGKFKLEIDKPQFLDIEVSQFVLEPTWESDGPVGFFNSLSVSANAGVRQTFYTFLLDRDFTAARIDSVGHIGDDAQGWKAHNFEFLIEGTALDGRLDLIVGYNFFRDRGFVGNGQCIETFKPFAGTGEEVECIGAKALHFEIAPFNPLPFGPPVFSTQIESLAKSHGIFAHATIDVTDYLALEVGGRQTFENRSFENIEWRPIGFGKGIRDLLSDDNVDLFGNGEASFEEFTPMASVTFKMPEPRGILEQGILYFTFSEGFLSGGFNTELNAERNPALEPLEVFGPENVKNFEVGFKATMFNSRFRLNGAAFLMDYKNKQENISIDNTEGQFGSDPSLNIVDNVADAEIKGFELEFVMSPLRNLWINGGLSHLDSEFTDFSSFNPQTGEVEDLTNIRFGDGTADWTFTGNIQYTFPLDNLGDITARLGVYYESSTELEASLPVGTPPTDCFQDGYSKYNARVSWTNPSASLQLAAFTQNFTSTEVFDTCDIQGGRGVREFRLEPEITWGVEATYLF